MKKRITGIITAFAIAAGLIVPPASAKSGVSGNEIMFDGNSSSLTITPVGTDISGEIRLELPNGTITSIAEGAFRDCTKIRGIQFPSSIRSIGKNAFAGCTSLEWVDMTESAVTSIPEGAFRDCTKLSEVGLPEKLTSIGNYAFYNSPSVTGIDFPDTLKTIGNFAFFPTSGTSGLNGGLTSISLPNGLTSIGGAAFGYTNIENAVIPESVTSIGQYAFINTPMKSIVLPFIGGGTNSSAFLSYIFSCVESENGEVTRYDYPDTLKEVTLHMSCTEIPPGAFTDASNLERVYIPPNLKSIGAGAFQNSGITEITIPETVTDMGVSVFYGCEKLKSVIFENDGMTEIPDYTFVGCGINEIELPQKLTKIGDYAFALSEIEELKLPENTKEIGMAAFFGCEKLKTLYFPTALETIGTGAFSQAPVTDIYYAGTSDEFNQIEIDGTNDYNACLYSANKHYSYTPASGTPSPADTPAGTQKPTSTPIPTGTQKPTDTPKPADTPKPTDTPPPESVDYPYEITSLSVISENGTALSDMPRNQSFIISVGIMKTKLRSAEDYLFTAVYDTDGALLSLDYAKADFPRSQEFNIGFHVPAKDKEIGEIKAFVWSRFNLGEPLAKSRSL